jgi:hypothetical protein
MKYLSVLPIAVFSIALQAQTNASGSANANAATTAAAQAGHASASAAEATNVSAELTKKVDTKNAKVGDEVEAKTTGAAKLADGTKLPKGTKLLGKVTEAHARSSADKSSHLAFSLDRAVLRDGREIPVHAMLISLTRPSAMAASTADDMSMQSSGGVSGNASAAGESRGGLLGGAGRTAGGAVGSATNTVGNVGSTVRPDTDSALNGTRSLGADVAGNASSAVSLDHVAGTNMPGVTLSSATSTNSSGSLDAAGRNISLDSGTQMTLNIFASQQ